MYKKRKKNQYVRYVEIRTRRNRWTKVQFIKFKPKGKALFKLATGEMVTRTATKNIRWGIFNRYHVRRGKYESDRRND